MDDGSPSYNPFIPFPLGNPKYRRFCRHLVVAHNCTYLECRKENWRVANPQHAQPQMAQSLPNNSLKTWSRP